MSSKRSPAARVLEFFTTAPIGEAELVLGLVKEAVKRRKLAEAPGIPVAARKRTRTRKVNAKAPEAIGVNPPNTLADVGRA